MSKNPGYIYVRSKNGTCGPDRIDSIPYDIYAPLAQIPKFVNTDTSVCMGEKVTFKVEPMKYVINYVWSLPDGFIASTCQTTVPYITAYVMEGKGGKASVYGILDNCTGGITQTGYSDSVIIRSETTIANAGADISVSGIPSVLTLKANSPGSAETIKWSLISPDDAIQLENAAIPDLKVTISDTGIFYLMYVINNKYCPSTADVMRINVTMPADTADTVKLHDPVTSFNVFPIPAHEWIYIEAETEGMSKMYVYDVNGKQVLSQVIATDNLCLNVSHFAPGTYFIRIVNNNKMYQKKILIE